MPVNVWPESKIEGPQKEVEEGERKARWLEYCTSVKSCWAGRDIHHWRK